MNRQIVGLVVLTCFCTVVQPVRAKLLINEAFVNPGGSPDNPREFVEILSTTTSDSLTDVWLLEIANEINDDDISP
ncbi:MAG: hypothetical protein KDA57_11510, partial [Planctomycetales bacterium]|nr:hypothetical protein [Planctomycetales bacterium]